MSKLGILDAIDRRPQQTVQRRNAKALLEHFYKYHLNRVDGTYVTHSKNWELICMAWDSYLYVKSSTYLNDGYTVIHGAVLRPDNRIPERSPTGKPLFYRTWR